MVDQTHILDHTGGAFHDHGTLHVNVQIAGTNQIQIEAIFRDGGVLQLRPGLHIEGIHHTVAVADGEPEKDAVSRNIREDAVIQNVNRLINDMADGVAE